MDKKKILGIIAASMSAVASTLVTTWMTDRDIEKKVIEVLAKKS